MSSRLGRASHRHFVAAVNPNLHSDNSKRGMRLSETVVDIGAQRVKRKSPLQVPLGSRDLGAVQPPRHSNFDPLRAEALGVFDGSPHRSPESYALLELLSNLLGLQLRIQLRLVDLLNVDVNLAPGPVLDLLLELIDLGAFASDDYARTRGVDDDLQLVGSPLNVDMRNSGAGKPPLQFFFELEVFV